MLANGLINLVHSFIDKDAEKAHVMKSSWPSTSADLLMHLTIPDNGCDIESQPYNVAKCPRMDIDDCV